MVLAKAQAAREMTPTCPTMTVSATPHEHLARIAAAIGKASARVRRFSCRDRVRRDIARERERVISARRKKSGY